MRPLALLFTLLLVLLGAALLGAAGFVWTLPQREAARIEALLLRLDGGLEDATSSLTEAEAALRAGLAALPQVAETLERAALVAARTATALESARRSGDTLTGGVASLGGEARKLMVGGRIKRSTVQIQGGAYQARETLAQIEALRAEVLPVEGQLRGLAAAVREVSARLARGAEVLPRLQDRVTRGRAALERSRLHHLIARAAQALGATLALAGLLTLLLAGTRLQVDRLSQHLRRLAATPPGPSPTA